MDIDASSETPTTDATIYLPRDALGCVMAKLEQSIRAEYNHAPPHLVRAMFKYAPPKQCHVCKRYEIAAPRHDPHTDYVMVGLDHIYSGGVSTCGRCGRECCNACEDPTDDLSYTFCHTCKWDDTLCRTCAEPLASHPCLTRCNVCNHNVCESTVYGILAYCTLCAMTRCKSVLHMARVTKIRAKFLEIN